MKNKFFKLSLLIPLFLLGCACENKSVVKHSRHIPREHVNFETPFAKALQRERLCDTLTDADLIKSMHECGVSIIETRLVWNEIEAQKGKLDYSRIERDMDLIEKNGFKVGIFNWFQHPPKWSDLTKLHCLNHDEDSTIISLWDTRYIEEYDRLLKDFAQKHGKRVSFIYVGIHGDFGEVAYPSGVRHYKFSPPHNPHSDFWCGDKLARADFKKYLQGKYNTIENLNNSWKTTFKSFDEDFMPKLPLENNNIHQRIDWATWYAKSLNDFTDKICAITRKHFPNTTLGLPIGFIYESIWGGQGQLKSEAAKIAAKYNMTARWTGVAHTKEFPRTNVSTKRLSSPARFYGAKFGVEAAAGVKEERVIAAIYESLANSSSMFHNDPASILNELHQYKDYDKYLKNLPVYCDKAVFYPWLADVTRSINIRDYFTEFANIRKHCDYELADENMIKDGFLKTVKELILVKNIPIPQETVNQLKQWEQKGGIIYHIKGFPPVILETGEKISLGKPIENFDALGKNDGCFYTNHGNVISKFDPNKRTIEFIKK